MGGEERGGGALGGTASHARPAPGPPGLSGLAGLTRGAQGVDEWVNECVDTVLLDGSVCSHVVDMHTCGGSAQRVYVCLRPTQAVLLLCRCTRDTELGVVCRREGWGGVVVVGGGGD